LLSCSLRAIHLGGGAGGGEEAGGEGGFVDTASVFILFRLSSGTRLKRSHALPLIAFLYFFPIIFYLFPCYLVFYGGGCC